MAYLRFRAVYSNDGDGMKTFSRFRRNRPLSRNAQSYRLSSAQNRGLSPPKWSPLLAYPRSSSLSLPHLPLVPPTIAR